MNVNEHVAGKSRALTPTQKALNDARKERLARISCAANVLNERIEAERAAELERVEENKRKIALNERTLIKNRMSVLIPVSRPIQTEKLVNSETQRETEIASTRVPSMDLIRRATCKHFNLTKAEFLSNRRRTVEVTARFAAIYIAVKMTKMSLPAIGRSLGGRDHSTIIHARRNAEKMMTTNQNFAAMVEAIKAEIMTEMEFE